MNNITVLMTYTFDFLMVGLILTKFRNSVGRAKSPMEISWHNQRTKYKISVRIPKNPRYSKILTGQRRVQALGIETNRQHVAHNKDLYKIF